VCLFCVCVDLCVRSGLFVSPLCTPTTTGLLYQPQMIGEGDCGAIGGMKIAGESEVLVEKLPQH
jgi:hypothetical protein